MLSKISQRKPNTEWFHLYVEYKKTKQMNKHNKTETESKIQRTNWWLPEREERNKWGTSRGTNFQLPNKWVIGMKCTL